MRAAVLPVGGTGRLMLPLTATIPKPLLPLNMRAAIHYIVKEAVDSGFDRIGMVTKFRANDLKDYFTINDFEEFRDIEMEFITQGEKWGMADAVLSAEEFVDNEPFAVVLGDDIMRSDIPGLKQLKQVSENDFVIGCKRVSKDLIHKYGAFVTNDSSNSGFKASKIIEKPQEDPGTDIAVAGRYLLKPSIFEDLRELDRINGGISLTNAMELARARGEIVYGHILEGKRYDIGYPEGYAHATITAINENW